MIKEIIDCYEEIKIDLKEAISKKEPKTYLELVKLVINSLEKKGNFGFKKIYEIDLNETYQGDLLYIITAGESSDYYYSIIIYYGSCDSCDTLQAAEGNIDDFMSLTLHIVQKIKKEEID